MRYACGHYIVTSLDYEHDCRSRYCTKSSRHPATCKSLDCIQVRMFPVPLLFLFRYSIMGRTA
ncbi:unnamed protein product, partial [Mycena citricolor]